MFYIQGGNDDLDSTKKGYHKSSRKKKLDSDEEGSSDGDNTLELASSHSSDEDEATNTKLRTATIGMFTISGFLYLKRDSVNELL